MAENTEQKQAETQEPQADPRLRKPPHAGGPRRVQPQQMAGGPAPKPKSKLWKLLGPGIASGGAIGLGVQDWFDLLS